ncbi:adenylyl-sulfate kinase [Paenibacillus filicis]|uniref:Adenylyl-sulfate kinase n=1 Tax=Paenibacillus gyeongsangnamensis TaxID=3388067 RepID=A0ABT4Q6R6_9BACL|nr:adenylyl-sulfate kinase [Paenibacillus filicis]MCZ8512565.1 adenylyl-sulfate kinase [Paenibacillus filicis]
METKTDHIIWHHGVVTPMERKVLNGHGSGVIWFTGLSGSGKSSLASAMEKKLFDLGIRSYILDGDNLRHGLNKNLGFSPDDRRENLRRVGEVAKLFVDAGLYALSAFISPFQRDRQMVKEIFGDKDFIEVYVSCPLTVCEKRDPKGLYKKARKGEIKDFTGVSSPYEPPVNPDIVVQTNIYSIEECADSIVKYLIEHSSQEANSPQLL